MLKQINFPLGIQQRWSQMAIFFVADLWQSLDGLVVPQYSGSYFISILLAKI